MAPPDDRRERILEAAERLFRHYGLGKTTIGDIAREVGIGVGSVYLEFCSKADIVSELAEKRRRRILSAMKAAARRGDAGERLARALEGRVESLLSLRTEGAHACDLVACGSPKTFSRFHPEELAFVRELLEAGVASGDFAKMDAQATAELIERAHATFSPPFLFTEEPKTVLGLVRSLNALLLKGLCARPASSRPPRR